MTWQRIDLSDELYDQEPTPPDLHELLYSGMRHVFSGPPESAKTLIAYHALLQAVSAGKRVCILDFEMGPVKAKLLMRELGFTDAHWELIWYAEPDAEPGKQIAEMIAFKPVIVLLDAAAGAFSASGLDDNSRKDAELFYGLWIQPFWEAEIATLMLDHVVKNTENRGKFVIGSERKVGAADVHIGLDVQAEHALTRGGKATIVCTVHKDRGAFLPRPTAAFVELASDPLTHSITVTWRPPEEMPVTASTGQLRPTIKMDQVSHYLAKKNGEPASRNAVEKDVGGKATMLRRAIDVLIEEGYVEQSRGAHGALLLTLLKPYSKDTDDASSSPRPDLVPSSSGRGAADTPVFVPGELPLNGGSQRDEDEVPQGEGRPRPKADLVPGSEPDEQDRRLLDEWGDSVE